MNILTKRAKSYAKSLLDKAGRLVPRQMAAAMADSHEQKRYSGRIQVESELSHANPRHPLGTKARILLCGVFGPYAQDDEYGSRLVNPMELFHNQVTRADGPFSLRVFHRSGSLNMIQANVDAPCTVLEFPTLDQFIEEITTHDYDIVGISSIAVNVLKVKKMCEMVREHLPHAKIVVGGHIVSVPDIEKRIDADYIVKGDGILWFRSYLGQDIKGAIRHPLVASSINARAFGLPIPAFTTGISSAVLYPSVGCPLGCDFCCTSALFGGKGKHVDFYKTGDELFSVMCKIEKKMKKNDFFIQDENFLLYRKRALRLLELMEQNDKSWTIYVFTSANVLKTYSIDELLRLGISWVWLGLEGKESCYDKLRGVDTKDLVRELQSHGIRVLGSTIIGLENHTPENIDGVIDWAVSHDTDFHQFMLFMPLPGTPLYEEFRERNLLFTEDEFPLADYHGQYRFNYRHPHIRGGIEERYLLKAFEKDRDVNGPGIVRMLKTMLTGYRRYKNHPDMRIRRRILWESKHFKDLYAAMLWAAVSHFEALGNRQLADKLGATLRDICTEFGWKARIAAPLLGRILYAGLKREEKRLSGGKTYEPPMIRENNEAAEILERRSRARRFKTQRRRFVTASN